jgi:hypothetical protein
MTQLAEHHGDELGPATKPLGGAFGFMLLHQSRELQAGKVMQQLIEQAGDLYHDGALLIGVQRCFSNIILIPPLQEGNRSVQPSTQKPVLDTSDFNSPSARPNVRSPWALFTLLYLKFHSHAFLQTIKVHLLKTIAVKENLMPI